MAASDARPVPLKNTAYRVYFPILDADGDPVSGATGLDSEVSIDGAAFADCTNEATEIGSTGLYYLDLTASEMNGDAIIVRVQTSTSGAKTTPIIMYPEEAGDIRVNVTQVSGDSTAADNLEADYDGTGYAKTASSIRSVTDLEVRRGTAQAGAAGSITLDASASATDDLYNGSLVVIVGGAGAGQAPRVISDYVGSTKVASVTPNWTSNPDNTSVFVILPIGPADLKAWLGVAPNALSSGRVESLVGAMGADTITAAAMAADAIGSSELSAAAANKVRDTILADSTPFNGANIDAAISTRATPAQVNTEMLDVLQTDVFGELAGVPTASSSLKDKISFVFMLARNKITQTSTTQALRNDADSGNVATASVSDDGTTFTRNEWA